VAAARDAPQGRTAEEEEAEPVALTELVLVRHGQSTGNVAHDLAVSRDAEVIDIDLRDADVPLSDLGREQAAGLARWLQSLPAPRRPRVVWSSPYLRAYQTAQIGVEGAALDVAVEVDERLRDRELGILDLLTARGVVARFPEEAERRRWLGKLYYRPPGGESWADVALRLRSFLGDLERRSSDAGTVMIVCHDAVVLLMRYVCEGWDERELLDAAAHTQVANASVTRLVRSPGDTRWRADFFNSVDHLEESATPVTNSEDEHASRPA
jgi:broad specificity phosphatase PhoE